MRIDKFLKVSRILKRRTTAKDLASGERVYINGRIAKPATEVKVGDEVAIVFGVRHLEIRVLDIKEYTKKEDASSMYEVIREYREEREETLI